MSKLKAPGRRNRLPKITGLEGVCSLLKQQCSLHYCRNYHHSLINIPASSHAQDSLKGGILLEAPREIPAEL